VIGVSDRTKLETVASALAALGCRSGLVVSSLDGLDEISVSAETRVMEVRDGKVEAFSITPEEVGVEPAPLESVRAGAPERSAEIARAVLAGEDGPERSITLLNAGAAIYVGGRAGSIAEGVERAAESIDSGAARDVLERYVKRTRELASA
jgi:anthranilate phosphoribosyltransferase